MIYLFSNNKQRIILYTNKASKDYLETVIKYSQNYEFEFTSINKKTNLEYQEKLEQMIEIVLSNLFYSSLEHIHLEIFNIFCHYDLSEHPLDKYFELPFYKVDL